MKFDHVLPVAAIPKRAVAEIDGTTVTILDIAYSEPRSGLITWTTDCGEFALSAARRVPVNLPARTASADSGTAPTRRRTT